MRKLLATLSLGIFLTTAALSSGCACTEEDEEECRTTHNSCVFNCNPLGGGYDACVDDCGRGLDDCLDEHGCS